MGLNDMFQPIRSSLLSKETLLDVKDVFAVIFREESQKDIASSSSSSVCKPQTFNVNSASTSNENGTTLSFTIDHIMKLMSLINEVPSGNMQANMAGKYKTHTQDYKDLVERTKADQSKSWRRCQNLLLTPLGLHSDDVNPKSDGVILVDKEKPIDDSVG
nr:ribonuclease H-like domain-containing protein [Tanacetum cinerariifolium]